MLTVLLPGAPSQRPANCPLQSHLQLDRAITPEQMAELALALSSRVNHLIAGAHTDPELMQQACTLWPEAQCHQHLGSERWTQPTAAAHQDPVARMTPPGSTSSDAPQQRGFAAPQAQSTEHEARRKEAGKLIHDIFRYNAYGADQHQTKLDHLRLAAKDYCDILPDVSTRIARARDSGKRAHHLYQELRQKSRAGQANKPEFQTWWAQIESHEETRIKNYLRHELKKAEDFQRSKAKMAEDNRRFQLTTPALLVSEAGHPNAVMNLRPHAQWTVLIDETGDTFDADVADLSETDQGAGKVVALVLSDEVKLPSIDSGFHTTKACHSAIERNLHAITQHPVGVFGFSSQDAAVYRTGWLMVIDQLVRWVLRLLPIIPETPTTVEILIEQKGSYQATTDWTVRIESLLGELQHLNPQRYAQLRLSIRFITKHGHPCNGYVDTLANCWGSPDPVKKTMLQHFAFLGHCLIEPKDERAYERLLFTLEGQQPMRPADWYSVLQEAGDDRDQPYTLLHGCLQQLGQTVQEHPGLWQAYLREVRRQLQQKTYSIAGLSRTLDWLQRFQPQQTALPPMLQLQHKAAYLALRNHQGRCDSDLVTEVVVLADQLKEEDAPQACEVILRAVVAATNVFDFSSMEDFVEQWSALPIATVGLLNHAKLLSTRGQLAAFRGEIPSAIDCFDQALAQLQRLSDPVAALKDIQQTRTYRLFAQLSDPKTPFADFKAELDAHLQSVFPEEAQSMLPAVMAGSGSTHRYLQHLYCRALVTYPEAMQQERGIYLHHSTAWHEGQDHPWPLILAYRGWLLCDQGQRAAGQRCFEEAINLCETESNSTLNWIGCVLQVLAQTLELPVATLQPLAEKQAELRRRLPNAPHATLEQYRNGRYDSAQRLALLRECLPFNFH